MTSSPSHTRITLIIIPLVLLLVAGCGRSSKNDESRLATGSAGSQIVPIQMAAVETRGLSIRKSYSGSLEGEDQANVVAKIPERIVTITVHVGQKVGAGDVLVVLDKSGSSSQYFQAEASYRNAEKTLERMKSLYAEGAVSQQTLDGAQTAFDVAKANFDAARSMVELTTPIAGLVTAVNASTGDLANPGTVLVTVARIARMKIIFNLTESDVTHLAVGQKVRISSEAKPESTPEGVITQLAKSADVGSRSFEAKALFPNTGDLWYKPGMFCKVEVVLATGASSMVVPAPAIQSDGEHARVFVVRGGRAYVRDVRVGVTDGSSTEILSGIAPGDTVATLGTNNLRDSIAVTAGR